MKRLRILGMRIYKFEYEGEENKGKEYQALICNGLFLWDIRRRKPEPTKNAEQDKEVQLLPI
jgi:hypothetical protein